ncbi:MAG: phosphate ABC transporter permease subunit PstC [Geminicoccaceae bacterium]
MNAVYVLIALAAIAFTVGRSRAMVTASGNTAKMHSLPGFHGWYMAIAVLMPALFIWLVLAVGQQPFINGWIASGLEERLYEDGVRFDGGGMAPQVESLYLQEVYREAHNIPLALERQGRVGMIDPIYKVLMIQQIEDDAATYRFLEWVFWAAKWLLPLGLALALARMTFGQIELPFRARNRVERWIVWALVAAATVSILTTAGIVFSVMFESIRFFQRIPITEFLFGLNWSPQTAIRADQVGSTGAFGAVPLFAGTLLITVIAMLVAGPIGLFSAIYLAEYATPNFRSVVKPIMEILAGIPTVVYGFFAALTVAPAVRGFGESLGLDVASESALAAGAVMGIMIIPFVSSLSDDAISAVPRSLRDASLGLGATRAETISKVLLPAALPGIIAGFLLAISRAIGETMIVVMAAGLAANLTANPLNAVTTVTVQIVTLLVGDQEFDSAKTLAAFALGLVLFVVTLGLNVFALYIMQKYRERYD